MEITTDDSTDKDNDMKDTFKEYAEKKTPKEEKKAPLSLEALLSPDKKTESDKKSSLFEILGGIDPESEKSEVPEPNVAEKESSKEEVETQVPLEEMSKTEITEVAQDYVTDTSEEVTNEIAHVIPDSVEEAEAVASQAFLEELQNKINNDKEIDESAIKDAGNQALETLDIEPQDVETEEASVGEIEPETTEQEDIPKDSKEEETPAKVKSATLSASVVTTPPKPVVNPPGPQALPDNKQAPKKPQNTNALKAGVVENMVEKRKKAVESEDQLPVIQDKLEKQAGDLHELLVAQELKVRELAAKQFEQNHSVASEHLEQINNAPESNTSREVETNEIEKNISSKSIETMTFPLLLSLAETIIISGLSLRNLYEQGHFDQEQLRDLVKEYLDGENIENMHPELFTGQERLNELAVEKLNDDGLITGSADQDTQSKVLLDLGSKSLSASEINLPTSPAPQTLELSQYEPQVKSNKNPKILLVVVAAVVTGIAVILVATLI